MESTTSTNNNNSKIFDTNNGITLSAQIIIKLINNPLGEFV